MYGGRRRLRVPRREQRPTPILWFPEEINFHHQKVLAIYYNYYAKCIYKARFKKCSNCGKTVCTTKQRRAKKF